MCVHIENLKLLEILSEICKVQDYLFKQSVHRFVRKESDRPHQISNENEISFGFQIQR